jgi:predicted nucleic-acid-binding Zn-ribbon protein
VADKWICTHTRKCGWSGPEEEKTQMLDVEKSKEWGVETFSYRCPLCGNNEFYLEKDKTDRGDDR